MPNALADNAPENLTIPLGLLVFIGVSWRSQAVSD
jgi:hypothetical protein